MFNSEIHSTCTKGKDISIVIVLKLHLSTNYLFTIQYLCTSQDILTKLQVLLHSASYKHLKRELGMHIYHFRTGVSKQRHFHPWRKWMTTTVILWNYTKLTIQSNPVHQ